MPSIAYSARALLDLERISDFLARGDPSNADEAIGLIIDAVRTLERHPFIGRPVRGTVRELVISRGRTGFVALYRVVPDRVEILAIRHQREAGYS